MRRKRHTPEQIVQKLREAESELASGKTIDEVCKRLEVSQQTYFRWKKEYGGGKVGMDEVRRLKELEKENRSPPLAAGVRDSRRSWRTWSWTRRS